MRTSMDNATTVEIANSLVPLNELARKTVQDLDPENDLVFFRIRTMKNEMMIGVGEDNLYIVIQDARFIRTPLSAQ
nr:dynein light chain roadblock-type 2-like [Parasteatoda tepidariorum]